MGSYTRTLQLTVVTSLDLVLIMGARPGCMGAVRAHSRNSSRLWS
jgi:hypothetical protein